MAEPHVTPGTPIDPSIDPQAYGRAFADVYDQWYSGLSDPADLVRAITELSGSTAARILELGSGTGRLAAPLAEAGHVVIALDASLDMLGQMPRPGALGLGADMARLPLAPASVDGAFVAYNTFFNLESAKRQRQAADELRRVVRRRGFVAIEAFVPGEAPAAVDYALTPSRRDESRAVWITTQQDPDQQILHGAHLDFGPHGLQVRPWRLRYLTPTQMDDTMAQAGFRLDSRWADWAGTCWDAQTSSHVSVYRF